MKYEYAVESQWAGFWGGFGRNILIEMPLNRLADGGWRLIRTEHIWALWFWVMPRPRLLYIFEREQD